MDIRSYNSSSLPLGRGIVLCTLLQRLLRWHYQVSAGSRQHPGRTQREVESEPWRRLLLMILRGCGGARLGCPQMMKAAAPAGNPIKRLQAWSLPHPLVAFHLPGSQPALIGPAMMDRRRWPALVLGRPARGQTQRGCRGLWAATVAVVALQAACLSHDETVGKPPSPRARRVQCSRQIPFLAAAQRSVIEPLVPVSPPGYSLENRLCLCSIHCPRSTTLACRRGPSRLRRRRYRPRRPASIFIQCYLGFVAVKRPLDVLAVQ